MMRLEREVKRHSAATGIQCPPQSRGKGGRRTPKTKSGWDISLCHSVKKEEEKIFVTTWNI